MPSASEIEHDVDRVRRRLEDVYVQKLAKSVVELARLCEEQEQRICKLENAGNASG